MTSPLTCPPPLPCPCRSQTPRFLLLHRLRRRRRRRSFRFARLLRGERPEPLVRFTSGRFTRVAPTRPTRGSRTGKTKTGVDEKAEWDGSGFGWEMSSRRRPARVLTSLSRIEARAHMYTCTANVWVSSIVRGVPFSVAPCPTLPVRFRKLFRRGRGNEKKKRNRLAQNPIRAISPAQHHQHSNTT